MSGRTEETVPSDDPADGIPIRTEFPFLTTLALTLWLVAAILILIIVWI